MILQRPFPHESNSDWSNPVNDESRVIDRAEILPQKRIRVPDLLQASLVLLSCRDSRDAHLVVVAIEITQFDLRVCLNFDRLVVGRQVGDIDYKTFSSDRRDRSQSRLITVNRREVRESIRANNRERRFEKHRWFHRNRGRARHEFLSCQKTNGTVKDRGKSRVVAAK